MYLVLYIAFLFLLYDPTTISKAIPPILKSFFVVRGMKNLPAADIIPYTSHPPPV